MNHDEVPELDDVSRAFLERHATTGEPTDAELARVGQRVAALSKLSPAPLARRRLVPPEVWAAAAVVALVVGAQALYLLLRPAELGTVAALATDGGVGRDARHAVARPGAAQLVELAKQERSVGSFERAVALLEQCVELEPQRAECHRLLGASLASLAARDGDAATKDRARRAYEQFLEVAPDDDPSRAKVETILKDANAPPQPVSPGEGFVIALGTERKLTVTGLQRIAVGDASIADIKTVGNEAILIKGVAAGKTTLLAWLTDGSRKSWVLTVR